MPKIARPSRSHSFATFLRSPVFIVYAVCFVLLAVNLVFAYKLRSFNSDDVFWQAILLQWHPFSGSTATLGNSSIYVDKIPFYEFFNLFFEPGRKVLFAQAVISTLAGFTGFYFACIYFLKKAAVKLHYLTLLPFVWVASFGYAFIQLFLNTNWRGFQLGVSFVVFALFAAVLYGDIKLKTWWSKLFLVLIAIYAGLQIYSDPYFLYFTVGPLALLALVLFVARKIRLRQLVTVAIPIAISLLAAKLFSVFFYAAGIRTAIEYPMEFVHFENIADGINGSLHSILIIFGADFFGLPLKTLPTIAALLNFVLLAFIVYFIFAFFKDLRQSSWKQVAFDRIWQLFFVFVSIFIFATHSFSTLGQGTFTYRYFLFLVLIFGLLFALALGRLKYKPLTYVLGALLVIATLLNIGLTTIGKQDANRSDVANNRANALNYLVINEVKNAGYEKGYANYWDASISTYLSEGKISFLPSVCNLGQAQKWHWLINDNAFDKKADKSFYFYNPDVPAACTPDDIMRQFGEPSSVTTIGNKVIYFYNHDITPQLGIAKS